MIRLIETYKNFKELDKYLSKYSYEITSSEELKDQALFIVRHKKKELFNEFVTHLPIPDRESYNKYSHLLFFNTYGSLAYINDKGEIRSVIWNEDYYQGKYRHAVKICRKIIESSYIHNVFEYDPNHYIRINDDCMQVGVTPSNRDFCITLNINNLGNIEMKDETHTEEWFRNLTRTC